MKNGPAFIKTINSEPTFEIIRPKINEEFWYSADNLSIFTNDNNPLTLYTFKKLFKWYKL